MTLLILGVILWIAAHFFKRALPEVRARMGNKGKGLVALVIVASLALMIIGYRGADEIYVWAPPSWGMHLNNLLMLIAVVLMAAGDIKGNHLRGLVRHPMLAGVRAWAAAHLLVNGDLASIVLFGGMLAWAMAEVVVLNRATPEWQRPAPGNLAGNAKLAIISIVVFAVIAAIHYWLGYPVFPG